MFFINIFYEVIFVLKLRDGISPETLREYGFKPGKEFFGKERCVVTGLDTSIRQNGYHKFLTQDSDTYEYGDGFDEIAYTDEEFDIPMVQMSFKIGDGDNLYIDCAPSCTYHIGGVEMDIIADTIYQLTCDGLIEPNK